MSNQCRQASRQEIPPEIPAGILSHYSQIIVVVLKECEDIPLFIHEEWMGAGVCPSGQMTTGQVHRGTQYALLYLVASSKQPNYWNYLRNSQDLWNTFL